LRYHRIVNTDVPPQSRPALEALIALLVVGAAVWHLRGFGDLPVAYNEMYGLLTACLPLDPHEAAVLSVGHTLESLLQRLAALWFDVCSFSGAAARWPALLATLATLGAGAWLARSRRSADERLLTVVLLASAAHPLTYGHYGRPYAWLMLAGLATWILRDLARFSWLRALTGTAAALTLPHAVPLWAATLAAAWRRNDARRAGLALEGTIMLAATAWTAWLMTGPVAPYIDNLGYTLDGLAGQFKAETLARLWTLPTGPDALRLLATLAWPAAVIVGMRRRPKDARLWLAALALHGAAWLLLRPPAWPRYLLPETMAWPAFAAAALPAVARDRRAALGLAAAYAAWALATVHAAGPGIFRHVEMRGDPDGVGALLRDGDVLVSDGAFLSDMLLYPLAATREITVVIADSAPAVPWPTPPGPLALRVDSLRERVASSVRVVTAPAEVPWADLTTAGRRVVVAGIRSLTPAACSELCPDAFAREAEPLLVIDDEVDDAALRAALCGPARRRLAVVLDADSEPSRALFAFLRPESQAALARLCTP
jgi:hypothetical protein